jgi:hypothetical protein
MLASTPILQAYDAKAGAFRELFIPSELTDYCKCKQ